MREREEAGVSRPDLSASLWDDGEANMLIVKADPGDLTQGRQRSCELYDIFSNAIE